MIDQSPRRAPKFFSSSGSTRRIPTTSSNPTSADTITGMSITKHVAACTRARRLCRRFRPSRRGPERTRSEPLQSIPVGHRGRLLAPGARSPPAPLPTFARPLVRASRLREHGRRDPGSESASSRKRRCWCRQRTTTRIALPRARRVCRGQRNGSAERLSIERLDLCSLLTQLRNARRRPLGLGR